MAARAFATLLRIVGYITLPIELLRKGDWILSRDENDPDGPLVAARMAEGDTTL